MQHLHPWHLLKVQANSCSYVPERLSNNCSLPGRSKYTFYMDENSSSRCCNVERSLLCREPIISTKILNVIALLHVRLALNTLCKTFDSVIYIHMIRLEQSNSDQDVSRFSFGPYIAVLGNCRLWQCLKILWNIYREYPRDQINLGKPADLR